MIIWKPVEWYEGLYEVSDEWIRSIRRWGYMLKTSLKRGYPSVSISKKWSKRHSVHRLVAIAFIPNPDNLPEVDHINNDKTDFRACNLQWVTRQENMRKYYSGRVIEWFWKWKKGESHPRSKRVLQKTIWRLIIKEWDNTLIASKELKISQWSISQVCSGKRITAWGFRWEYL